MARKLITSLFITVLLALPAYTAEFTFATNADIGILRLGVDLGGGFVVGGAGQLEYSTKVSDDHLSIDDSSWGVFIKYPVIEFAAIPEIPVNGNIYADAAILLDWDDYLAGRDDDDEPILTVGGGVEVAINDHVGLLTAYSHYLETDNRASDDKVMAGVVFRF
jgi:opacity protein-like surface antigen